MDPTAANMRGCSTIMNTKCAMAIKSASPLNTSSDIDAVLMFYTMSKSPIWQYVNQWQREIVENDGMSNTELSWRHCGASKTKTTYFERNVHWKTYPKIEWRTSNRRKSNTQWATVDVVIGDNTESIKWK